MEHLYSECRIFKKEREKGYLFIDLGETAVFLNYGSTMSLCKLLNLKCKFTLYHEGNCANLSLSG
jgi:hypothetical protein